MREKKLSTCHLYVNMYFVTLHHFVILQMKGTKFIATILTNYNLQITIANYNCGPYEGCLWRTRTGLAYGQSRRQRSTDEGAAEVTKGGDDVAQSKNK